MPTAFLLTFFELAANSSHEALMVQAQMSERPLKNRLVNYPNTKLSYLPNVLPHGLAPSPYIHFDFQFPCESDFLLEPLKPWSDLSELGQIARLSLIYRPPCKASNRVHRGVDEICQRLAEVPVKRSIKICWSDCSLITESVDETTVLRPFSRFWSWVHSVSARSWVRRRSLPATYNIKVITA